VWYNPIYTRRKQMTLRESGAAEQGNQREHASLGFVIAAYAMVAAGLVLGNWLAKGSAVEPVYDSIEGIGLFAVFYAAAQAMERLVEPLSELNVIPGFGARKKEAETAGDEDEADRIKANTKVAIWALASLIAMLLCGATHLYLLDVVGVEEMPDWLNVLVTGLAIAGGTEPLHKLIGYIEKKSEDGSEGDDEQGG
jgi:hypothetical protein